MTTTTESTGALAKSPSAADRQRYETLGLVAADTVTLLVPATELTAASFTPLVGDVLTWAGIDYAVREIGVLAPDGTPILYTLVVAR